MAGLKLYHYWRSSSSWRVRFALDHKGVPAELIAINLLEGQSDSPEHLRRNPMGYVPVLEISQGGKPFYLAESVAIIEWLEETQGGAKLLPADPIARAQARELSELINSGIQPLQNLGVAERHSEDPEERKRWTREWIHKGFTAFEKHLERTAGTYCVGDQFTMADVFLAPQVYSASRFQLGLEEFPRIARVHAASQKLSSYQSSHPDRHKPADFKG